MGREFELVADFEVAPTEHGRVDGEQDGLVTCLFCAVDELGRVCTIFKEVKLENVGVGLARLGHVFEGARAERRQAHHYTFGLAGACRGEFAVRVRQFLHCRRGDAKGTTILVAKDVHRGVDLGYVA